MAHWSLKTDLIPPALFCLSLALSLSLYFQSYLWSPLYIFYSRMNLTVCGYCSPQFCVTSGFRVTLSYLYLCLYRLHFIYSTVSWVSLIIISVVFSIFTLVETQFTAVPHKKRPIHACFQTSLFLPPSLTLSQQQILPAMLSSPSHPSHSHFLTKLKCAEEG